MTESLEQLRRLKNTIMGASHRLSLLAGSEDVIPEAETELRAISADLTEVVRRLERVLLGLRDR